MTVIISRSKRHVHLGRMLVATTTKLQLLGEMRVNFALLLKKFSQLDDLYSDCSEMDLPTEDMSTLADDKVALTRMATATMTIKQVVDRAFSQAVSDLGDYEKELDKAERAYQKTLSKSSKKAVTPPPPTPPEDAPTQKLLNEVGQALIQAEKEKL